MSNEDSTLLHNSLGSPYSKSESLSEDSDCKVNRHKGSEEEGDSLKFKSQSKAKGDLIGKRKTMEIMQCPHKNQKHYAKVNTFGLIK